MVDLEQQLRETYAERLDVLDPTGADAAAARRSGVRMRNRRRLTVVGVAAAVVAVALAGVVDARREASVGPSGPLGHWRELPAPPLSPRAGALAVWTGREAIVLGGSTEVCPPNADCAGSPAELRDGAAYDVGTGTWRAIPPAPVGVGAGDRLLMAGGVVVLEDTTPPGSRWFTYEPDHNRWARIRHAPAGASDDPSSVGSRVYVHVGRRLAMYDVKRGTWTLIPRDRLQPRLAQDVVTATSSGPVVGGYDRTQPNDGTKPSLVLADLWDGKAWRRFPPSDQLDGSFSWTGRRLVDPTPFTENGGDVNGWGRDIPQGGTLDPATGEWGRLPAALTGDPDGLTVSASGGPWFAVAGQVYDDDTGRVYTLDRPDGAPDYAVTGVWAGGRLLVFGGTDSAEGFSGDAMSNDAWLWTP
jgi:hypothetical protein